MRKPQPTTGGVYDPRFKYTSSNKTDIAKTFDRLVPGWKKRRPECQTNNDSASIATTAVPTTSSLAVTDESTLRSPTTPTV